MKVQKMTTDSFDQKYNKKQTKGLAQRWVKMLKMLIGSFKKKVRVKRTGSSFKCKSKQAKVGKTHENWQLLVQK